MGAVNAKSVQSRSEICTLQLDMREEEILLSGKAEHLTPELLEISMDEIHSCAGGQSKTFLSPSNFKSVSGT